MSLTTPLNPVPSAPHSKVLALVIRLPLLVLTLVLVAITGGLLTLTLNFQREQAIEAGQRLTESYAQVIEEQTTRTIQTVDQRLQLVARALADLQAAGALNEQSARVVLRENGKSVPFVRAMWVMDVQGRIVYDADVGNIGVSLKDRPYFQIYLAKPDTIFHLGEPVRSRSTGTWLVSASRQLKKSDGSFDGIIVAAVEPPYFDRLWRNIDLGTGGSIALLNSAGVMMMRSPFSDDAMGKSFQDRPIFKALLPQSPIGSYVDASSVDGTVRLFAYRTLSEQPDFLVVVGQSRDFVLAEWRRLTVVATLVWLTAAVTVMLLSFLLDRIKREQARTQALSQQDVRDSEARYRELFEGNPHPMWVFELETLAFLAVNDAAIAHYGYGRSEFLAMSIRDIRPIEDVPRLLEDVAGLKSSIGPVGTWRHRCKDGSIILVEITSHSLNFGGRPSRLIHAHDVTARQLTENKLRLSEENLAITLQSIGDAVIATDTAGLVTRMNPTAEQLTGWSLAEALGQPLTEVFCIVNGQTRLPLVNSVQRMMGRDDVAGVPSHTVLLARDGHEYQIADSAAPIRDATHTMVGVVLVFSDVTEQYQVQAALRQAKAQLEIFFNHSPVAVAMFDRDMRYLHVSERWLSDYGLTGRELCGLSHYDVFPEITDVWKVVHQRGISGETVGSEEDCFERSNGTLQWLRWEVRPWHDANGGVGGILLFSEDITRRRAAEEAVIRSEEFFRKTVRLMPAPLALSTPEGVLVDFSDEMCTVTGFSREELIGHTTLELGLWVDPEERLAMREALQTDGEVRGVEFQMKRRDGSVTTMQMSICHIQIDDKPLLLSFGNDISTRKAAETALRDSELMLRNIVDGFGPNVFVGLLSVDGFVRMANQSALAAAGLALEDVIGKHVEETKWFRYSATAQQQMRDAVELAGQGIPSRFDVQIQGVGEEEFLWIDFSLHPVLDEAGRVVYLVPSALVIEDRKRAEVALLATSNHLRTTLNAIPDLLFEVDVHGRVLSYQAHPSDLTAMPPEAFLGKCFADVMPPAATAVCMNALKEAAEKGWTTGAIYAQPLAQGETWFELSGAVMPINGHGEVHFILLSRDVTERIRSEESLRIAATAFESRQGMIITDAQGVILQVNKAFVEVAGHDPEELIGRNPRFFKSGRQDAVFYRAMWGSITRDGFWQGELWNKRGNGEVFPAWVAISGVKDDAGSITHFVGTYSDISERKSAEQRIETLAYYDTLTGLPNRDLLRDRLQHAQAAVSRSRHQSAVLHIDLDDFKSINDTLGHDQGDKIIQEAANRLRTCARATDTVARIGGDEFILMLEGLSQGNQDPVNQARVTGQKVLAALRMPYLGGESSHHSSASIGIALFGGDEQSSVDEPLKQAELAMYQAKAAGRNTLCFFDPQMQAVVNARTSLESRLRDALVNHQFVLYHQPQVDSEGHVTGTEALVRWLDPKRGMVSPAEFIPVAEQSGLILPLGQWVLETACSQLVRWAGQPKLAHLTVAVNVSARQFNQSQFVDEVVDALKRTGANPKLLKLELTESMLAENIEGVIAKMSALKGYGVNFSLDDFGTGYSSLAYLKRLPLAQLKIDQGFVRDILIDHNDAAIAKMVIALADSMGLTVIAEGVETEGQRDFLAQAGCRAYQGYLFSRPLPLEAFEAFIHVG